MVCGRGTTDHWDVEMIASIQSNPFRKPLFIRPQTQTRRSQTLTSANGGPTTDYLVRVGIPAAVWQDWSMVEEAVFAALIMNAVPSHLNLLLQRTSRLRAV